MHTWNTIHDKPCKVLSFQSASTIICHVILVAYLLSILNQMIKTPSSFSVIKLLPRLHIPLIFYIPCIPQYVLFCGWSLGCFCQLTNYLHLLLLTSNIYFKRSLGFCLNDISKSPLLHLNMLNKFCFDVVIGVLSNGKIPCLFTSKRLVLWSSLDCCLIGISSFFWGGG